MRVRESPQRVTSNLVDGASDAGLPKVRIDHVTKSFPRRQGGGEHLIIDRFSLDIAAGEFVSLIGPSGCGKSTMLEIVAGLQEATSGAILIDGREVKKPGPERAVVFQSYALFPWRTVLDNASLPLEIAGVPRAERRELARKRLVDVGLGEFTSYYPSQLSGGMRQRVALARAFVRDPDVLLMDEPFGALDAITRDLLQEQIGELHQVEQRTVLFVTHSVSEAIRLSNRIIVMSIAPAQIVGEFELGPRSGSTLADFVRREAACASVRDEIWGLLRQHGALDVVGAARSADGPPA
jgi:ABC-type nitrate/sulfonate/bicarbonate transport system ATPase subunit